MNSQGQKASEAQNSLKYDRKNKGLALIIIFKNASKISDSENDKKDSQFFDDITDEKKSIQGLYKETKDNEIVSSFLKGLKAMIYIS